MVKPSLVTKIISVVLIVAFLSSQVYADVSGIANDKLSPSLISDPNINPERNVVRNNIAEKAEPGAIGNGAPLLALAQGKLPPRITIPESENEDITRKLLESISLAIKLSITNQNKIPPQHQTRLKQTLANLITLQQNLSKDAYLYNADIRGPEDYLLGFNFQNYRGFAVELIMRLYQISPNRLAQYIYHECVPEKGIITERDDHRIVYNEIQSAIFGQDEVIALKTDFREFIQEGLQNIPQSEALPLKQRFVFIDDELTTVTRENIYRTIRAIFNKYCEFLKGEKTISQRTELGRYPYRDIEDQVLNVMGLLACKAGTETDKAAWVSFFLTVPRIHEAWLRHHTPTIWQFMIRERKKGRVVLSGLIGREAIADEKLPEANSEHAVSALRNITDFPSDIIPFAPSDNTQEGGANGNSAFPIREMVCIIKPGFADNDAKIK